MGFGRLLIGVATAGLSVGPAHAAVEAHLDDARAALVEGVPRQARNALGDAHAAFATLDAVVRDATLARYWYYRGLQTSGRRASDRTLDAFRQALVVDGAFQWDRSVNENLELRRVFEALRGEVAGRETRSAAVPERTGCAVPYIDGGRVGPDSVVSTGLRLAQIACPRGDVVSRWVEFSAAMEPLDWLAMCPYAVDTTIEPAVAPESDEEFAGVDVAFGEETPVVDDPCASERGAGPTVAQTPTVPAALGTPPASSEPAEDSGSPPARARPSKAAVGDWSRPRTIVTGAGAGLLTTGVVLHFAVVKPSFAMVEFGRRNNEWITAHAADVLTKRFVERRALAWSLAGVGSAVTVSGLLWPRFKPTATVQPHLTPMGVGMHGRF